MRRNLELRLGRAEIAASATWSADRQIAHHREALRVRIAMQELIRVRLQAMGRPCDAAGAMAAITGAVAAAEITPGEAGELAKLVEAFVRALEASEFDQRLRALEARSDATRS